MFWIKLGITLCVIVALGVGFAVSIPDGATPPFKVADGGGSAVRADTEAGRHREMKPVSPEAAAAAMKRIEPHLRAANAAGSAALTRACERIGAFFDDRKKRARSFAEDALSFRGKWEYMKGAVRIGNGHQHFLHGRFEEKVFSQKELADLLESVVEEYLETIRGIESGLLVKIRVDLEEAAAPDLRNAAWLETDEAFRSEYGVALKRVTASVSTDVAVLIGREAASWVASDVAASLATSLCITVAQRMGVSAAITGSGIVTGATTLGLGIVAGIIIDAFLDWIIKSMGYDPVADVEDQIVLLLDEFEGVFTFGDLYKPLPLVSISPNAREDRMLDKQARRWEEVLKRKEASGKVCKGFCWELGEVFAERAEIRDAALRKLLTEGGSR